MHKKNVSHTNKYFSIPLLATPFHFPMMISAFLVIEFHDFCASILQSIVSDFALPAPHDK